MLPWEKRVFIIAEIGINHNGDVDLAKELIKEAAQSGADAVKFQAYKAEYLVGKNSEIYNMIKRWELSLREMKELKKYAESKNVVFFSSFFDSESLNLVKELDIPLIKIPSGEITNKLLLEKVSELGKPVILSTGMSYLSEVGEAIQILKSKREVPIALLHCVSVYPSRLEQMNLLAIKTLAEAFKLPVGLSDHTPSIYTSIAAVALGAKILEKHFTLDKNLPGPDHKASITPEELKELVSVVRKLEKGLGSGIKEPLPEEMELRLKARKSLILKVPKKKGEIIRKIDLETGRPATGISPMIYELAVGKKLKRDVEEGEMLRWEDLEI